MNGLKLISTIRAVMGNLLAVSLIGHKGRITDLAAKLKGFLARTIVIDEFMRCATMRTGCGSRESRNNPTLDWHRSSTIVLGLVDFNSLVKGNGKRFRLDDRIDIDIETFVRFTVDDRLRIVGEEIHKKAF